MPDLSILDPNRLFFDLREVGKITGIKLRTLQRHLEQGELKRASRPRKKVRIAREELLIFTDKMRRGVV